MYNNSNNNNNFNMNNNGHNALLTDAERAERLRRLNELYQQQEMHQQQQHQHQHPQYNTLHQGNTVQPYYGNSHINNSNNNNINNNNHNRCYVEKAHDHDVPINDDEDEEGDEDECIDKAEEAFLDKMEQHMNTMQLHHTSAPHSVSGNANTNVNSSHAATGSSSTQTTFYRIDESEMNTGTVIATEVNVQRRTIGDFELLRLAKIGDKESFYQFASMTHTTIASFEDNQKRNALHYAADSGNLILIRALHEDRRVFDALNVSDVKGLLPIDIALLNGYTSSEIMEILQPSEAAAAASAAAEQTTLHTKADKNNSDNNEIDNALKVNALLAKFAPTPPRFVLSKPIPPAPSASNQTTLFMRSFWRQYKTMEERVSAARTTLSEAQSARHIHVMEYTNLTHTAAKNEEEGDGEDYKHQEELQSLLRKFCTHMQHASREHNTGLLRALHDQCLLHTLPVLASNNENNNVNDHAPMTPKGCRVFCALQQKSTTTTDKGNNANIIGVLVVKMVQGTFHYGKEQEGKANASVTQSSALVRVVYLGVLPEYRKSGVASLLLHYVYLHLSDNTDYDSTSSEVANPMAAAANEGNNLVHDAVVFFTTSSQLIQPPNTVGAVKWFARILQPSKLFKIGENSYHYVHSGSLINNTTLLTDATQAVKAEREETSESSKDDSSNASKNVSTISTSNGSCMTITGNDLIANLFHSFVEYDTVLRADIILKNALPDSFVSKLAQLCTQWMLIDDTHIDHVASFLATTCQSATQSSSSSLFETTLCFVPTSAQELRAMLQHNNNNNDLRVYARFAQGAHVDKSHEESNADKNQITDLVIVQVHTFKNTKAMTNESAHSTSNVLFNLENDSANTSTEQNNNNNNNNNYEANTDANKSKLNNDENWSLSDLHVAQVVFTMFTTFKGVDKVEVMLSLANQYIHADALFVPTVCGTTDSDLVKVNFEEFLDCREFLYAVNRKEPCNSCALPTPVSQLCLPLCLCEYLLEEKIRNVKH